MTLLFLPHWRAEMPSSPTAPLHDSLKDCEDGIIIKRSASDDIIIKRSASDGITFIVKLKNDKIV